MEVKVNILENNLIISDEKQTEFKVMDDIRYVSKGVYIRTEEIYKVDDSVFIVFSTSGAGPKELDLSLNIVKEKIEESSLKPKEYNEYNRANTNETL